MKKKMQLCAAALAILATTSAANASTKVTLYGVISTGIGWQELKGTNSAGQHIKSTKTGIIDQSMFGNQFGLIGTEEINSDLSAVFHLISGFNISNGQSLQGGRLFGRQATLGLKSKSLGLLELGRQTNLSSKYLSRVATPFGGNGWQVGVGATMPAANTVRYDNLVLYQTPTIGGFQGGLGYSFNTNGPQHSKTTGAGYTTDADEANAKAITAGLRYNDGPIAVALAYEQIKYGELRGAPGGGFITGKAGKVHSWNLAASYDFKMFRLHSAFGQSKNGLISNSLVDAQFAPGYIEDLRFNSYMLGVSVPVAKSSKIFLTAGFADPRSVPTGAESKTQKTYSVAVETNLSKRTSVYAFGSTASNVGFYNKMRSSIASVGVTHKF